MSTAIKHPTATRKSTKRIIVLDNIAKQGIEMLEAAEGIEYEVQTGLSGEPLRRALQNADGAVCRSGVTITAESLEGNTTLKAIARAGVGTDNIDKEAATKLGIVVMNTPTGNTVSTAEHTMALMLGLSRNVAPAFSSLQNGKWDRKSFSGRQLQGKTLGIVGLGRIGIEVGKRAKAFRMDLIGYDPFLSDTQIETLGMKPCNDIRQLLPQIDYLTVHTPLTPETRDLINESNVADIKPGARLINCARGGIYNEAALVKGLQSGVLGGVALDVYENEPCTDSPLFKMPGVLCTPHLGASTAEAQIQVATEAVDLLIKYLKLGEIKYAVNTAAIDPKTVESIRGYVDAAYRMGILLSGWHGGGIEAVSLDYSGELAGKDHRLVTSAFCVGMLQNATPNVNIINARALAGERGIDISTSSSTHHDSFSSVISAQVSGEGQEFQAACTVFGKSLPRLIGVGGFRTDAYMDGIILLLSHRDLPGVIGHIGNIFAKESVNITQMAVGRVDRSGGGPAIGVLNLDTPASPEALANVADHEGIEAVRMIQLPPADFKPDWL